MDNHLVEATVVYKMGHQVFKAKMAIIGRNVQAIEEVPMEVPEYTDGALSRIRFPNGEGLFVADPYDTLKEKWIESLQSLE